MGTVEEVVDVEARVLGLVKCTMNNLLFMASGNPGVTEDDVVQVAKGLVENLTDMVDILPKGELKQVWHVSRAPLQYSDEAAARRSALASRERLYTQRQTGWEEVEL